MDGGAEYRFGYPIELWARSPIVLNEPALTVALAARLGTVEIADEAASDVRLYFFKDYPVQFEDRQIPAQLAFFVLGSIPEQHRQSASVEQALQQSWGFPGARAVFDECRHRLLLTNMMSWSLDHHKRRKIIANGLLAILETAAVDLIFWSPTQQMLSPAEMRQRYSDTRELANPLCGFLNVRFFNIANSDGDMLMDTLGLSTLGLTDFQVHFRQLEPKRVAQLLYQCGAYAFEKGDVIKNGQTVDGLSERSRWVCRREVSLMEPQREVLDINPGPQFAAGKRG